MNIEFVKRVLLVPKKKKRRRKEATSSSRIYLLVSIYSLQ